MGTYITLKSFVGDGSVCPSVQEQTSKFISFEYRCVTKVLL